MLSSKEISPLVQKTETNSRKPSCKFIIALSFVLVLFGFVLSYFIPSNTNDGALTHQSFAASNNDVTPSTNDKGIELKYHSSSTYKGAVLEYDSVYHKSYYYDKRHPYKPVVEDFITSSAQAKYWQDLNIERITPYIEEASAASVDILVLSEFALNGLVFTRAEMFFYLEFVPDPDSAQCISDPIACTPCANDVFRDRTTLQQLSCLASDNNLNLVVNYGDYRDCEVDVDYLCEDGHYQYNTQIVFDFNGQIISKYHKIHTYEEDEYNVPFEEDPTTFTIQLPSDPAQEVTFGILICYDSMYGSPLLPLIKEGVTDFVMSHWWVNTAPSMNIDMWTQAVSKTYGINLLVAANTWINEGQSQNILTGEWYIRGFGARDSSGSGIYSKGTVKSDFYNQENVKKIGTLLIADLPIGITSNADDLPVFPDYILTTDVSEVESNYCEQSQLLSIQPIKRGKDAQREFSGTLECDSGFKCTVTATIAKDLKPTSTDTKANYMWMYIFDGYYQTPDGGNIWYYENFCVVAVCDENCYNYGLQGDTSHIVFDSLSVSANYDDEATMFVLSAGDDGTAADDVDWETTTDDDGVTTVSADDIDQVLINLSVMGRVFSKDTKVVTNAE